MDLAAYCPTISEVAKLTGKSGRWIAELRASGDLPPDGASLAEFWRAWEARCRAEVKVGSLDAERARLASAQAEKVERQNAVDRGDLAPKSEMVAAGAAVIGLAVARLSQVGALVAGTDFKLRARIDLAVNDVLEELSTTRVEQARDNDEDEDIG